MTHIELAHPNRWQAEQQRIWAEGKRRVAGLPERTLVVKALAPVSVGWVERGELSGSGLGAALELPDGISEGIATAIRSIGDGNRSAVESVERGVAWHLLIEAIAQAFLDAEPSVTRGRNLYAEAPSWPWFYESLRMALRTVAERQADKRERWLSFLERLPDDLLDQLEEGGGTALRELAEQWGKKSDPFSLFSATYRRGIRLGWSSAVGWEHTRFGLLLCLSPERWLRALDALPLPHLVWQVAHLSRVDKDRELLEELINNAPPTFDETGRWTRSVGALVVTDLVLDHLVTWHSAASSAAEFGGQDASSKEFQEKAKRQLVELERSGLQDWATRAYALVLDRGDGEPLLFEILARVTRGVLIGEWTRQRAGWSAKETAMASISLAMIGKKIPGQRLRDWYERREGIEKASSDADESPVGARLLNTDGLPYLVGGVQLLLEQRTAGAGDVGALAASLWEWAVSLIVGRDPGLDLTRSDRSAVAYRYLGALLASIDDPYGQWQVAYAALEPQRRRIASWNRREEAVMVNGSMLLVWVGVYACSLQDALRSEQLVAVAEKLLATLIERARFLYLTAPNYEHRTRARVGLFASCFAPVPRIFGARLVDAVIEFLPGVDDDPVVLREVVDVLQNNDVSEQLLDDMCQRLGTSRAAINEVADRLMPRAERP